MGWTRGSKAERTKNIVRDEGEENEGRKRGEERGGGCVVELLFFSLSHHFKPFALLISAVCILCTGLKQSIDFVEKLFGHNRKPSDQSIGAMTDEP